MSAFLSGAPAAALEALGPYHWVELGDVRRWVWSGAPVDLPADLDPWLALLPARSFKLDHAHGGRGDLSLDNYSSTQLNASLRVEPVLENKGTAFFVSRERVASLPGEVHLFLAGRDFVDVGAIISWTFSAASPSDLKDFRRLFAQIPAHTWLLEVGGAQPAAYGSLKFPKALRSKSDTAWRRIQEGRVVAANSEFREMDLGGRVGTAGSWVHYPDKPTLGRMVCVEVDGQVRTVMVEVTFEIATVKIMKSDFRSF